jgi:SAM-dependent methyltransferase
MRKLEGHIGIDRARYPGVDIICDVEDGLPLDDDSVDGVFSNFLFEHVSNPVHLFQEVYRVCRDTASVKIRIPYYQSVTQYKDPTHRCVIVPEMIEYFSGKPWYGADYDLKARFKLIRVKYEYLPPFSGFLEKRYYLFRPILYPLLLFARRFLWNVVHSITIEIEVSK